MLSYNFLIAIRRLFKNKLNAAVNILGLAIGLTSVILMLLYIKYETTYDQFNENYDRLFRVERNYKSRIQNELWDSSPYALAKSLTSDFPEIENAACVRKTSGYLKFEEVMYQEKYGMFADNEFLQLFTFNFKQGNQQDALASPMSIVISESLAKRLSPQGDLLDKTISLDKKHSFIVKGIFEDIPANSHLQIDYLLSFNSYNQVTGYKPNGGWNVSNATVYVQLNDHADETQVAQKIRGYLDTHTTADDGIQQLLSLRPVGDIYTKTASVRGGGGKRSEIVIIYLFLSVAIFTTLISVLNYINASTADVINRELEIGIKKVLCISKAQLRIQFICESLAIVIIAFFISILLLLLTLPFFNMMVDKDLALIFSRDWLFLLQIFIGVLIVGALSGLYPVLFLSSLKISAFLQGNASVKRRTTLRKVLVVFQLAVVMPLIFTSILIINQINFIENKDIGFTKQNLLVARVGTPDTTSYERLKSMKSRLLQNPNISDVAISTSAPFQTASSITVNWEGSMENDKIVLRSHEVDYDFIDTYQMQLVEGRGFSKEYGTDMQNACIINETALQFFGWKTGVGKTLDDNRLKVIGVVKDFNDFTLFKKIPPMVLLMNQGNQAANYASVRVNPNNRIATQKMINNLFNDSFHDEPLEFKFLDAELDASYLNSLKGVTKIFIFFSIVAIVLAILGLYSLVSFSLKTQKKMIAVRKVLGASIKSLFLLLLKEYLLLFSIAAVFGLLTVYIVSFKAVNVFAYHEEVKFSYLIISGLLALLVVLLSVSSKIFMASKENPIKAISSE